VTITVALDGMGGDHGPKITIPAALLSLQRHPKLKLLVVGLEDVLRSELAKHKNLIGDRLQIYPASQVVAMDEEPAKALRRKKDSSMRVAINLVKQGVAHACVSAGNTGALMATARFVLKTLPGIDRPAIITTLPTIRGHVHVLDLGANVDCSAELLRQFGVMGAMLVKFVEQKPDPAVALLNIGVEDIKGNTIIKEAAELLRNSGINYQGFVEGNEIYTGNIDVVVCDGFVGNVALKTSEGLAQMMIHHLKTAFKKNIFTKVAAVIALPVMKAFHRRLDPRRYNGATLVGLRGTVIKSHGGADVMAMCSAIDAAVTEIENDVPLHIERELKNILGAPVDK